MYLFTKSSFLIKQIIPYLFVFKGHWCRHRKMHCATDWSLNTKLARFWRPKSSSFSNSQWKSQVVWIISTISSMVGKKCNLRKVALLASNTKINGFWNFFERIIRLALKGAFRVNICFPKMLIVAFEVCTIFQFSIYCVIYLLICYYCKLQ